MFLTRSEYGRYIEITLIRGVLISELCVDRGVNTFSPEGRLFQGGYTVSHTRPCS